MWLSNVRSNSLNGVSIPNVLLKTMFKIDGVINFCHLNVASVKPKIDELRTVFHGVNAHAISFSETWFKSYNTNKSVEIEEYNLVRCDRRLQKSGGVAIYLRKDVKFRIVASSTYKYDLQPNERFKADFLLVELVYPDVKILYGVFYKAVKTNEVNVIDDVINKYTHGYEHVILAGDFNENLLDMQRQSRMDEFENIFTKNDMHILNDQPTHYFPTGASLLDLFIARNSQAVKRINQIDTGMSLHDVLVMSYQSPSLMKGNDRTKLYRNFKAIDEEALYIDTCLLPWENIIATPL